MRSPNISFERMIVRNPAAALAIFGRPAPIPGTLQPATAVAVEALAVPLRDRVPWRDVGFVTAWEVQSRLATMAMVALVAFVSIWGALAVMLAWALVATSTDHSAQRRGRPDLLENTWPKADSSKRPGLIWVSSATLFGVTACNHLLRAAGYSDGKVLKLSFLGPVLNVPSRVLLSAFVVGALMRHLNSPVD